MLPRSELVIVTGASHLALLDKPDAINDGLVRLVNRAMPRRIAFTPAVPGSVCVDNDVVDGTGPGARRRYRRAGRRLGEQLRAGDAVVLSGPLDGGKTALAKGIAAA